MVKTPRYIVELRPPTDPSDPVKLYTALHEIRPLLEFTKSVSIISKPLDQTITGFDLSYQFASYLLEHIPEIEILFHLTCYDINKINIQSRLDLLRRLGIEKILVISGDGYELSQRTTVSRLQYQNSHELVRTILKEYKWFKTIAIAGYPGGDGKRSKNNQEEVDRLSTVIELGATDVYTQCLFDDSDFSSFKLRLNDRFPELRIIPSLAIFESSSDLEKISRLTRVTSGLLVRTKSGVETVSRSVVSQVSSAFLLSLIILISKKYRENEVAVFNLCPFGNHEQTRKLMSNSRS